MCDYSLSHVASRPAKVGDELVTRDFGTGTRGFAARDDLHTAVCLLPGTEIAFANRVSVGAFKLFGRGATSIESKTAIFRQINKQSPHVHHDALEFPDGQIVLLTNLLEWQVATVLQLPATPTTQAEKEEQKRVDYVG
jgi:hypothetical protein